MLHVAGPISFTLPATIVGAMGSRAGRERVGGEGTALAVAVSTANTKLSFSLRDVAVRTCEAYDTMREGGEAGRRGNRGDGRLTDRLMI